MKNGSSRPISTLQIGDETLGGNVTAVMSFARNPEHPLFLVDNKVIVSGVHALLNPDGRWTRVMASPRAVLASAEVHNDVKVVYDMTVTDHVIFVQDVELPFSDYAEVDGTSDEEIALWDAALNKKN